MKRLYKSNSDKKLLGVCGGLADYFNVDSTIIRLLWVIFTFMYGTGFIAYILCALIIPQESDIKKSNLEEETSLQN